MHSSFHPDVQSPSIISSRFRELPLAILSGQTCCRQIVSLLSRMSRSPLPPKRHFTGWRIGWAALFSMLKKYCAMSSGLYQGLWWEIPSLTLAFSPLGEVSFFSGDFQDSSVFSFQKCNYDVHDTDFFGTILSGVHWASQIYRFKSLPKFGEFPAMISLRTPSAPPSSSPLKSHVWAYAGSVFR